MDKKVSVVIVSHDLHDYLERCILSIEKHTEKGHVEELVVVDNGSTEKYHLAALTELTAFPVCLIRSDQNESFARANNRGVASARAVYICYLNNDIEVLPGWLPPLYEVINRSEKIGAVGPKMIFPDGSIQFAGYEMNPATGFQKHRFRDTRMHHSIQNANNAGPVTNLTGACLLLRKEDACFDERYWYGCEDTDLCVQLKQKNKVVYYQPASVVVHHEEMTRSSGLVTIDFEYNRELFKKKWGGSWKQYLWQVVR
jgi:GT2 family glycosyltransferase